MADLNFTRLTIRNFQSVGNAEEELLLNTNLLTLVLGENLDSGGENSRNGVGKSTFISAWYFALFGSGISAVKKDNLVNSINHKNMEVTLEFTKYGKKYKIERGRKPAFLRFYIDDGLVKNPEEDEALGENKHTQEEIDKIIGVTPELLKQILVLTTESAHVLEMRPAEQRPIIEELLGITTLSSRADTLKELIKNTKEMIKEEEIRIKTVIDSNNRINRMIADLEFASSAFEAKKEKEVNDITSTINELSKIDINKELKVHEQLENLKIAEQEIKKLSRDKSKLASHISAQTKLAENLSIQLESLSNDKCPTCKQNLHDHDTLQTDFMNQLTKIVDDVEKSSVELEEITKTISEYQEIVDTIGVVNAFYKSKDEALQHQFLVQTLKESLEKELANINPYVTQIDQLKTSGLQSVSRETLDQYQNLFVHQEFMHKLLTNKDSFIRKKIIDSNISQINYKINSYLKMLMLPNEVSFNNDLTVEIKLLGRDYDYPQLSRGERTRVKIATSLALS